MIQRTEQSLGFTGGPICGGGSDGGGGEVVVTDAPPELLPVHPLAAAYKRRQAQTTLPIQATNVSYEASSASPVLLRPIQVSTP
jgi:hypothetical protein